MIAAEATLLAGDFSALKAAPGKPAATGEAAARKAAEDFESVLIANLVSTMFAGIETEAPFGGGHGEAMVRSQMYDEYAKAIAAQGGLGLADSLTREILRMQEGA